MQGQCGESPHLRFTGAAQIKPKDMKTYNVVFNDDQNSNSKEMHNTYEECLQYIKNFNGSDHSYFADYKGGTVLIVCNETEEIVYSEKVR